MKYIFCLIALFMLQNSMGAQEKFERYTINLGLMLPVYGAPNTPWEYTLVPEGEFLVNLPLGKTTKLSTGIGIESGKHIIVEDEARLTYVEPYGWVPYEGRNFWDLEFISMKVPVYFSVPFNNSFLDAITLGSGLGWLVTYDLTEDQILNTSHIKINRSYLDLSFGVKKKLFQFNKLSLSLNPQIGYRAYLNNYNNWQKKCFLAEVKLNVSF